MSLHRRAAHVPAQPAWLALLARYRQALGSAWSTRRELDGPARLPHEREFLPARMALQETPPHPAPRRAALAICAFFLLAALWSLMAEVDVVATATGRLAVSGHTKLIQPLEPGVVRAIHVQEGSRVRTGDLLVELDATGPGAEGDAIQAERDAATREVQATAALLSAMSAHALQTREISQAAAATATAEWADIQARQAQLGAEIQQRQAELRTHREAIAKLEATLPMSRQREADLLALQSQGFVASHASQDRTRERIEMESDLATLRARRTETVAALAERERARQSHWAEVLRALQERQAQAKEKLAHLAPQAERAAQRQRLTRLLAPVDGTVQQLAVHTEGGVVTEAQSLMVIVPTGATLQAEVMLDNKDIGFVHTGQAAEIKFETFNYTRYGTVPATVTQVSADAVLDEKRGPLYTAILHPSAGQLMVEGRPMPLGPGMALNAEIKTGRRRVMDYLLSPLQRMASESLRER